MTKEETKSILADIANYKKELVMMRIKSSSGEALSIKEYKEKKKNIAKLFTKLNSKAVNNKKDKK